MYLYLDCILNFYRYLLKARTYYLILNTKDAISVYTEHLIQLTLSDSHRISVKPLLYIASSATLRDLCKISMCVSKGQDELTYLSRLPQPVPSRKGDVPPELEEHLYSLSALVEQNGEWEHQCQGSPER